MYRMIVFILSLLGFFNVAMAQSPITTRPIQEYILNNGLKLIVVADHRSPVVLSSVWYKVGGSYEHNGITGLSHMLEHMMFKGTKRYPTGELKKMVASAGGKQNAMTTSDFTMYYQELPADQLAMSLRLEADRMHNLILSEQSFKHEQQVVTEERRMRIDDNPQALAWVRFRSTAFINSPYHQPVIGWKNDIKNYKLNDLKDWYRTWYAPDNAVLVVVGDEKPLYVLSLVRKYFGAIQPVTVPILKPRVEEKSLGKRINNVTLPAKLPILFIGYNVPSLVTSSPHWQAYALDVLQGILDIGDSSRLYQKLIQQQKIAVSVSVGYDLYSLHAGLFEIDAIPAKNHSLSELQKAIRSQIKQLKTSPVSSEELQRVKTQLAAKTVYAKDSLMNQAMEVGLPEMVGLSWQVSQDYINNIDAVTPAQIQKVAKLYLNNNNMTVGRLHLPRVKKIKKGNNHVKQNKSQVTH